MPATRSSRHPLYSPISKNEFAELRNNIVMHYRSVVVGPDCSSGDRLQATQRLLARIGALQASMVAGARAKAAAHTLQRMAMCSTSPTTTTHTHHALPALCLALVFPSHAQEQPHCRADLLKAVIDATSCTRVRALALQELDLLARSFAAGLFYSNT